MPSSDRATIIIKDTNKNYYQILNIPFSNNNSPTVVSKQQLKNAYHKALLKYHPDKAGTATAKAAPVSSSSSRTNAVYTVDDITDAYKVLSDPVLRAEYDREWILRRSGNDDKDAGEVAFHTGLEVVDLEDMGYQDDGHEGSSSYWYRGCRCGDEKGFIVTEDELETEAQHGEILVGCRGCSLWMKVLFAVAGEEEEEEEEEEAEIDSASQSLEGS
ncbi:Diphthamide biosynthesis protein 4 [Talaromyces atroroseus]|uniref:Diphthamide biosynthesis protein 4 n=1 Tax=Talaromyces atroroseus TaxID=1441469 RepID=A0A225A7N1_TALAT|nr:Diphthamide biosynthesis protein 4 [Talaromyces atroroseus]OKL56542.1 Diphthamide biosynthesis protein 4 [Talaromyces atroroseus]